MTRLEEIKSRCEIVSKMKPEMLDEKKYIDNAKADIPYLLGEIERLENERDELSEQLEERTNDIESMGNLCAERYDRIAELIAELDSEKQTKENVEKCLLKVAIYGEIGSIRGVNKTINIWIDENGPRQRDDNVLRRGQNPDRKDR